MALFQKKTEKGAKVEETKKEEEKKLAPIKASEGKEKRVDLAWKVLKSPHVTEKATDLTTKNQYIFNVYPSRNKEEIKKAVQDVYGVNVVSVKVIKIPAKKRRMGKIQGWRAGYKKALVEVKSGQKIELMPR